MAIAENQTLSKSVGAVIDPIFSPRYRLRIPPLKFFNGIRGFAEDGREYVIHLRNGRKTPAPWFSVIANDKDFGFQISDAAENSQQYHLPSIN